MGTGIGGIRELHGERRDRSIGLCITLVEGTRYTVNGALTVTHGRTCGHASHDRAECARTPLLRPAGRADWTLAIADSWLAPQFPRSHDKGVILLRDSLSNGAAFASGMIAGCVLGGISPVR